MEKCENIDAKTNWKEALRRTNKQTHQLLSASGAFGCLNA
jgi:hypothetical protein